MNERAVPERAPSPVEKPNVLATPPMPTTATPDLPPIAADADDLKSIKQAVDDAASVGGALWLSYLFVLFYLAVAAGAVTHADLFFENPVKLPFLNIELPLLAFFFLAPILFLVVHAYTLVHLVMLTDKAKHYHQALYDQIGDKNCLSEEESRSANRFATACGGNCRATSSSNFWPGQRDLRGRLVWLAAAGDRVGDAGHRTGACLLLLTQVQFLPFHSGFISWTHRIVLLLDLGLIVVAVAHDPVCARRGLSSSIGFIGMDAAGSSLLPLALLFSRGRRRRFQASGKKTF